MKKIITFILTAMLFGGFSATHAQHVFDKDEYDVGMTQKYKEHVFKIMPNFNPDAKWKLTKFEVENLNDESGLEVFEVYSATSNADIEYNKAFRHNGFIIVYNKEIKNTYAGSGVRDYIFYDNIKNPFTYDSASQSLNFTFSRGSGITTNHKVNVFIDENDKYIFVSEEIK